jgi:hypothetical protein
VPDSNHLPLIEMPSQYDNRTDPAYDSVMNGLAKPLMACNRHILKWWTPSHDEIIKQQMSEWLWYWHFHILDKVLELTDPCQIESWKKSDPACRRGIGKGAWNNVLQYFAYARATSLGLDKSIRVPQWRTCPLCSVLFLENSLPEPLAARLGINNLDFCAPCLTVRILQNTGNDALSAEEIKCYLKQLSILIQAVPRQGFGEGVDDLKYLSPEQRLAVLRLLGTKPSISCVKTLFTSWLHALVAAEVLESGARKTSRGTMCLALDGHTCFSLAEKTIDDFLFHHGIAHSREPHYPDSEFRADFEIEGSFVEYFGLAGNQLYDEKIQAKKQIAKMAGIKLISIYPKNLVNLSWLEKTLLSI